MTSVAKHLVLGGIGSRVEWSMTSCSIMNGAPGNQYVIREIEIYALVIGDGGSDVTCLIARGRG